MKVVIASPRRKVPPSTQAPWRVATVSLRTTAPTCAVLDQKMNEVSQSQTVPRAEEAALGASLNDLSQASPLSRARHNDSVRHLAQYPVPSTGHPHTRKFAMHRHRVCGHTQFQIPRSGRPLSSSPRGSSQVPRARTLPHWQMPPRSCIYIDPLILPIESQIREHILSAPNPYFVRL